MIDMARADKELGLLRHFGQRPAQTSRETDLMEMSGSPARDTPRDT